MDKLQEIVDYINAQIEYKQNEIKRLEGEIIGLYSIKTITLNKMKGLNNEHL